MKLIRAKWADIPTGAFAWVRAERFLRETQRLLGEVMAHARERAGEG